MINRDSINNIQRRAGSFLIAALLSGIFCSCTSEADGDGPVYQSEVKLVLEEAETKSSQYNTFEVGDAIGVFAFVRSDNAQKAEISGTYANNKKWVWNGSEFLPESVADKVFFSGSKKMDFYAYYPYNASSVDPLSVSFSASENQSTVAGYAASDFLTAVNNTGIFNQTVHLNFKHRLSTIRLMVEDLGNIKDVTLNGVGLSASLNQADNIFLFGGDIQDVKMYNKGSKDGYYSFDACVPVQPIPADKNLFTVHREGADDIHIKSGVSPLQEGEITTFNIPLVKTITVSATTGGTATGGGKYAHGHSLTVVATAGIGYTFDGWFENNVNVSSDLNYNFRVTNNRTLEARYSKTIYTINASVNNTLGGTVSGGGEFTYDQTCQLTQSTNTGYTFNGWYENGARVYPVSPYSFAVQSSRNLEARYTINRYTLTVINGTGSGVYDYGTNVTLSALVPAGKTFYKWSDNNTNATRTVAVTENATYRAEYQEWVYLLTVTPTAMYYTSNGGTKSFSVTSTRTLYINDIATSTVENAAYSVALSGVGFSVSGTQVSAAVNNATTARTGSVTIQQTGGKSATITLEQDGTFDIETEI